MNEQIGGQLHLSVAHVRNETRRRQETKLRDDGLTKRTRSSSRPALFSEAPIAARRRTDPITGKHVRNLYLVAGFNSQSGVCAGRMRFAPDASVVRCGALFCGVCASTAR